MEDKYLYMKTKNKCLPCLILDGNQYIFNCLNVDPVRKNDDERVHCSFGENTVQFVLYLDGILDEDCVINKDGVIEYHDPHCKHCFSHDVIKKSYNRRKIYLENGVSVYNGGCTYGSGSCIQLQNGTSFNKCKQNDNSDERYSKGNEDTQNTWRKRRSKR